MKTLVLSRQDVQRVVLDTGVDALMDELMRRLQAALGSFDARRTEIPIRTGFRYESPAVGMIEWMPLMQAEESVLMKVVGYHPSNPSANELPTVLSTACLHDTTTGHLIAVCDATFLTALRTGAASGVASRLLASPDTRTVGLIGCGAQAVTQLHALSRVFALRDVLIHDVDPAAVESFPARVAAFLDPGVTIRACPVSDVVSRSDVLSVATSVEAGQGPVFDAHETQPWLHVNAVGSDFPGKTELPLPLLRASLVCPDSLEQARLEGECQQLDETEIGPDIVEVVRRASDHEAERMRRTVFDSTGWALEDHVAAGLLLEHARRLAIGTEVELECISADPRHPYEFLESNVLSKT